MQKRAEIYVEKIQPLVDQIYSLCEQHDIPLLVAACIEQNDKGNGMREMVLAAAVYLNCREEAPEPMMLAASMLRLPGYEVTVEMSSPDVENEPAAVH